jgi:hypothetical protein
MRGLPNSSLWLLAALLVAIWLVGLLFDGVSLTGLALIIVEAVMMLSLLLSLSERDLWKPTVLFFCGGLALYMIEIMLVQTLPQYADVPLDSKRYDVHAQALVDHWRGLEVVAKDYYLHNIDQIQGVWLPTDWFSYGTVFGSRSFLYQLYVGVFYLAAGPQQTTVILSHTVPLAALAPVVFNLSNVVFDDRRVSTLAASLTLADLSFVAVGAWLLRDSLIALLMALAIWTTVLVIRNSEAYYPMVVLVAALLGLSILRYHAVEDFWLAVGVALLIVTYYRSGSRWLLLVFVPSYTVFAALLLLGHSVAAFFTALLLWAATMAVRQRKAYYLILALAVLVAALVVVSLFDPGLRLLGLSLHDPDLVGLSLALGVAVFLAAVTWRAAVAIMGKRSAYYPIVALVVPVVGLLGGVSVLLYHVLAAFWLIGAVTVLVLTYYRGGSRRLLAVLVLSLVGSQALYTPPSFLDPIPQNGATIQPRAGSMGQGMLKDQTIPSSSLDSEVQDGTSVQAKAKSVQKGLEEDQASFTWLQSLRENPPLTLTKTVAHTLFGPYPWVPFANGLSYNQTELFYPGTVMWILGWPFLLVALWCLLIRGSPHLARVSSEMLVILIWTLLIVSEYIVYQGEFSTRQRVFMMPLFWTLIAFGVVRVRTRFNKAKTGGWFEPSTARHKGALRRRRRDDVYR